MIVCVDNLVVRIDCDRTDCFVVGECFDGVHVHVSIMHESYHIRFMHHASIEPDQVNIMH